MSDIGREHDPVIDDGEVYQNKLGIHYYNSTEDKKSEDNEASFSSICENET